jgi:hypothetical protein
MPYFASRPFLILFHGSGDESGKERMIAPARHTEKAEKKAPGFLPGPSRIGMPDEA